jgi:hypothetical protein
MDYTRLGHVRVPPTTHFLSGFLIQDIQMDGPISNQMDGLIDWGISWGYSIVSTLTIS